MSQLAQPLESRTLSALPALFEEVVRRRGPRTAIAYGSKTISYEELNGRANQVARLLRSRLDVRPGTPVGLFLDRSPELYVITLAVLKAGGHVVPLNPSHPAAMLRDIVRESAATTVVHDGRESFSGIGLAAGGAEAAALIEESAALSRENPGPSEDPEDAPGPDDVAYVLFTSGSTGRPKGVRIPHRGLARLARPGDALAVCEDDCFLQQAVPSFAASMNEIWMSLLNGARLAVMPPGLPSLSVMRDLVARHAVSVLSLPCGLFNLLVENETEALSELRVVMVSGDFPSPRHLADAAERTPARIFNGYGCTENSAISALYPVRPGNGVRELTAVPVGKPMPGVAMYVLDERLEPCPEGEPGELYIAGEGLAAGYLDPVETAEKFTTLPGTGTLVYRTGDRARRTADGDIVLIGRSDGVVKVRGYRVETGAVELAVRAVEDVDRAVVKAFSDDDNETRLVAFFTTVSGRPADAAELSAVLHKELPDYMVPTTFRHLDEMPVNLNGKIDRAALDEPAEEFGTENKAPMENPLESVILQVWKDIVGVADISATDPFLGHGGNSLHFVRLASTLEKVLAVEVQPEEIFRNGDVRKLARHLDEKRSSAASGDR